MALDKTATTNVLASTTPALLIHASTECECTIIIVPRWPCRQHLTGKFQVRAISFEAHPARPNRRPCREDRGVMGTRRDKLSQRGPAFPAAGPSVVFRLRH